jgi:hypothetical protein
MVVEFITVGVVVFFGGIILNHIPYGEVIMLSVFIYKILTATRYDF